VPASTVRRRTVSAGNGSLWMVLRNTELTKQVHELTVLIHQTIGREGD
jgi:hypothetical protein